MPGWGEGCLGRRGKASCPDELWTSRKASRVPSAYSSPHEAIMALRQARDPRKVVELGETGWEARGMTPERELGLMLGF